MITQNEVSRLKESAWRTQQARVFSVGTERGGGGTTVALVFLRFHTSARGTTSLVQAFELDDVIAAALIEEGDPSWDGAAGTDHLYPAGVYFQEYHVAKNKIFGDLAEVSRPCPHVNGTDQHYHFGQPTGPARCSTCDVPMVFDPELGHWIEKEKR